MAFYLQEKQRFFKKSLVSFSMSAITYKHFTEFSKYRLLHVLLCSIAEYFYELCCITNNEQIVKSVRANFADIYLRHFCNFNPIRRLPVARKPV